MLENLDPSTIEDPALRQVVMVLMNRLEELEAEGKLLKAEIQRLRDENNRLKGEQGKPKFAPKQKFKNISSEKERGGSKAKPAKAEQAEVVIDHTEVVRLDRKGLPIDVRFKGYEETVVQEVEFKSQTILFKRERYYSPSQKMSYTAPIPKGYEGGYGAGVKAWALELYYQSGLSEPKLLAFLHTVGITVSAGQLSDWLIHDHRQFEEEKEAVLVAGLGSGLYSHLDSTQSRLNGEAQHCHVLTNPLYTAYLSLPHKDRLSIIRVLMGGKELTYLWDEAAEKYLEPQLGVKWLKRLRAIKYGQSWSETEFKEWLAQELKGIAIQKERVVRDALAISGYRAQKEVPVVEWLVCDDAPQFEGVCEHLALCWVHEGRHYKKLEPKLTYHQKQLERFLKQFWDYYHLLLDYRLNPTLARAGYLEHRFEQLFKPSYDYEALNERLKLSRAKKSQLLAVLLEPTLLLHNNPAELGARQRVRKLDVSLQTRTTAGLRAWDTFQSLVATTKQLGLKFGQYVKERLTGRADMTTLANLIKAKAEKLREEQPLLIATPEQYQTLAAKLNNPTPVETAVIKVEANPPPQTLPLVVPVKKVKPLKGKPGLCFMF